MKGTRVTHIKLATLIRRASRRRSNIENNDQSTSSETAQQNSEKLIPTLNFIAQPATTSSSSESTQYANLHEKTPPPIPPRRTAPAAAKNAKNNQNDIKKLETSKNLVQRTSSEESSSSSSTMEDPKKSTSDNSTEEEIEELIPSIASSSHSDSSSKKIDKISNKKRQLFGIDPDPDDDKFQIDDEQLSGKKLFQHFTVDESSESSKLEKSKSFDIEITQPKISVTIKSKSLDDRLSTNAGADARSEIINSQTAIGSQNERLKNNKDKFNSKSSDILSLHSNQSGNGNEARTSSELSIDQPSVIHTTSEIHETPSKLQQTNSEHITDHKTEGVILPDHSLTNQSTANDVSELVDEISDEHKAQSLELSSNYVNNDKPNSKSLDNTVTYSELTSNENKIQDTDESRSKEVKTLTNFNKKDDEADNDEKDHSLEEMLVENQSVEVTFDENLSDPSIDVHDLSKVNRILSDTIQDENINRYSLSSNPSSSQDDDMDALKVKILSLKQSPKSAGPHMAINVSFEQTEDQTIAVKQMETVQADFTKEILEDITEESEKVSAVIDVEKAEYDNNNTSDDFDSIVSLNMIQMLENKVKDLQDVVAAKDVCLSSLNMQLDTVQRRESYATMESYRESLDKLPPSGRDSCSLTTNSTEYRALQEEFGNKVFDFHNELTQRDHLIEKLTDSLQQSMTIREDLQQQSDKLNTELQLLRKQLVDLNRKPYWPNRDQESNCQRLSEISIDLVSESDDDLDRHFLTDNEEKMSRNSRDRQMSLDLGQVPFETFEALDSQMSISKQIEQFQKYLNPDELRIFFMVQKKFDDFLSQEIAKNKLKYDNEIKILADQMEAEKHDRDIEINRLKQLLISVKNGSTELIHLRQELDGIHAKEMEDLRLYFEKKCAELEKQYSEEVFSQQSHRNNDIQSDISDQENLPDDEIQKINRSKEGSPRKRTREELYASPSHRQMTPTTISPEREPRKLSFSELKIKEEDPEISVEELKMFYKEKLQEINITHDKVVKKLTEKLIRFETKYADDEFMSKTHKTEKMVGLPCSDLTQTSSYIIIDEDETNDGQEIDKIAAEYERRLVEQVRLAKEDIIKELENQIQTLLSETTTDDHHWPPELILLREKFTAKSQLEIAQLQIKHEEEMSRLKADLEKQLNRKIKRQSTFDLSRDLDQIITERDSLRELSLSFRHILSQLAKCVSFCEDDFNATFLEELQRLSLSQYPDYTNINEAGDDLNNTIQSEANQTRALLETTLQKRLHLVPDVSNLLNVIDDPKLVSFINTSIVNYEHFNLKDCLQKLESEAHLLLELSENLCQKKQLKENEIYTEENMEKNDSCEEEDGLKSGMNRTPQKMILRANSLNENMLRDQVHLNHLLSLPPDLSKLNLCNESIIEDYTSSGPVIELNFQVNELRNRLVKSESDRVKLQRELEATIKRNCELGVELAALRDQLEQLDSNREDFSEGYSLSEIKSPQRIKSAKQVAGFSQLQEKARNLLSTPTKISVGEENTSVLLHVIEDFCREGDKVIEDGKKDRDDLKAQIDAADKQLKATRQFLEDQAAERELERDDFVKEIEKLKYQLRDKEKERTSLQNVSKEAERMEYQIKELTSQISEYESRKDKLEIELKASIDKIFVLREIISELETQVETKALNEHVLNEKVKELESYIGKQNNSNETLQQEVESLKTEIGQGYQERIIHLEDALRNSRPSAEQSAILQQFGEQLRDISTTLEQKTKTLEALHQSVASVSLSSSPAEDVSIQDQPKNFMNISTTPKGSPMHLSTTSPRLPSLPIEEMEKVFEKLSKHTRVEEAAIKRIKDLEMHIGNIRNSYGELQQERDTLQEKMSEQMLRISTLQTKLDEQRRRAEDLNRNSESDLNIKIHDLQTDIENLTETLTGRDKQILNLKNHLQQSKTVIDRQEAELAMDVNSDRSAIEKLETELKTKIEENKKLKEKIKSEMINKLALPDLMETMLADKNEEIDHLKEQLELKENELKNILSINLGNNNSCKEKDKNVENGDGKLSARTLSDIVSISDFDEPDVVRRAVPDTNVSLTLPESHYPEQTMESSKLGHANLTSKRTEELALFNSVSQPPTFDQPNFFTSDPSIPKDITENIQLFEPRQINFSEFVDDSKLKESTPKQLEPNDEVHNLKTKLTKAENEIDNLKISINKLENEKSNEIQRLQTEFDEKIVNLEKLQNENIQLENQIADINEKLQKTINLEKELTTKEEHYKKLENEFIGNQLKLVQCQDSLDEKTKEISNLEQKITDLKCNNESQAEVDNLNGQIQELNRSLNVKSELLITCGQNISKLVDDNNICKNKIQELEQNIAKLEENQGDNSKNNNNEFFDLQEELNSAKAELSEKVFLYEKCMLDIQAYQKELEHLKDNLKEKDNVISTLSTDSKSLQTVLTNIQQKLTGSNSLNDLNEKLTEEKARNLDLQKRIANLEIELEKQRSQNSESSNKPMSLDEIAQQVEKELNYSAQLDSNILKAIESEEENNLDLHVKTDSEKLIERDLLNQLQGVKNELEKEKLDSADIQRKLSNEKINSNKIKEELDEEKLHSAKIEKQLNEEKLHSVEIQEQDGAIIEAMRLRLEEALNKEQELHKIIDEEREKCDRLATQISVLQRSEARKTSLLLKSPPDSPRKSPRSLEFESDLAERLKSEIKLLSAQNERERERVTDLQRVLEREKSRFDTELNDRIEHGEKLKKEMERIAREKDLDEQEIEHLQERLTLQSHEIESLEKRIVTLQEAETRRAQRRDKERIETTQNMVELQELKSKLLNLESERDHLNKTTNLLRGDIDRSAQREAKLADALASNSDSSIPQQFLTKMKEMNSLLSDNTKENRQMAEAVHVLIDERKSLQRKCEELEGHLASGSNSATNISDVEDRANQLLGRLLRVESHRKALVHQKRYLLISLQSYQDSETKAMALLNGPESPINHKKNLFKSAALAIIAVQRMKFIVRRWHTGKRIVSKSVFTITQQKRSPLSSTNFYNVAPISLSPPCRDTIPTTTATHQNFSLRPLQSPALISECTSNQSQPQKIDWATRFKK